MDDEETMENIVVATLPEEMIEVVNVVCVGEKPEPVTVIGSPGFTDVGDAVTLGATIVKVALAELPSSSFTEIVCEVAEVVLVELGVGFWLVPKVAESVPVLDILVDDITVA